VVTDTAELQLCRHCEKAKATRPRTLCWSCYYRPGVREKYPVARGERDAPCPHRDMRNRNRGIPALRSNLKDDLIRGVVKKLLSKPGYAEPRGEPPLSPRPTTALPGTPEKVAVLEERRILGLSLWHPLDATWDWVDTEEKTGSETLCLE
jgi:hypothetical protein